MKIRRPWLIKLVGFLGMAAARGWMGTLGFRIRHLGSADAHPRNTNSTNQYIYALWHENMLLPAFCLGRRDLQVLISKSADAQLFADILRFLRIPVIRGSTNRGGIEAVRQILRNSSRMHLTITPDGPRGPRRHVQPGTAYLASRTGMAIIPTGFGYEWPWRLRSWDRFAIPRPWTRGTCVTAPAIHVPADVDKVQLENYRGRVEEALRAVSDMAEQWAETGRWPGTARLLAATNDRLGRRVG
jgi:lysophospholipid acyltransferase (LPLAT)-like uncharacterized protein